MRGRRKCTLRGVMAGTPHPVRHARAAILAVGDELAIGQSLDTNSRWLAERLTSMGIRVEEHRLVRGHHSCWQRLQLSRSPSSHAIGCVRGPIKALAHACLRKQQ